MSESTNVTAPCKCNGLGRVLYSDPPRATPTDSYARLTNMLCRKVIQLFHKLSIFPRYPADLGLTARARATFMGLVTMWEDSTRHRHEDDTLSGTALWYEMKGNKTRV